MGNQQRFGDYDRGSEGFQVTLDVTASFGGTGSGGDEVLNDSVNPTNEVVVGTGITDGDIDYSVLFQNLTLVGSNVTIQADYTYML